MQMERLLCWHSRSGCAAVMGGIRSRHMMRGFPRLSSLSYPLPLFCFPLLPPSLPQKKKTGPVKVEAIEPKPASPQRM